MILILCPFLENLLHCIYCDAGSEKGQTRDRVLARMYHVPRTMYHVPRVGGIFERQTGAYFTYGYLHDR
jgi:hypothetical protein